MQELGTFVAPQNRIQGRCDVFISVGAWIYTENRVYRCQISTHRMVCVDIRWGLDTYTAKHRMVADCRLSWQLGTECWGHALHVVTPGVTLG